MLKDHQKSHVGTHYKGTLVCFLQPLIIYNNWYTETDNIINDFNAYILQ